MYYTMIFIKNSMPFQRDYGLMLNFYIALHYSKINCGHVKFRIFNKIRSRAINMPIWKRCIFSFLHTNFWKFSIQAKESFGNGLIRNELLK